MGIFDDPIGWLAKKKDEVVDGVNQVGRDINASFIDAGHDIEDTVHRTGEQGQNVIDNTAVGLGWIKPPIKNEEPVPAAPNPNDPVTAEAMNAAETKQRVRQGRASAVLNRRRGGLIDEDEAPKSGRRTLLGE